MATSIRTKAGQTGNRLLDRLAPADFKSLAAALEPVHLPAHQVVFHPDDAVDHLYFPVTTVLTLTVGESPEDGRSMEFTSVGREGMVGFTALLGVPTSLHQVACHAAGDCLRLPTAALAEAMSRRRGIDALIKRYMAVAYRTAVQAVVCNALHPVEQRVCRWLLVTHEKAAGEFPVTQDFLAARLGVKRPTISVAANSLQKAGLISYHRGVVRILDRAGLEQSACGCFRITQAVYERIMER
jgi:CRP-like cAMP-binding protein